jgi:steroid delta-isomerase
VTSAEQKRAVVDAYISGFAEGNAQKVADLFAADAIIEDPVGTPEKIGREQIVAFYQFSVGSGAKLELLGEPRCAGAYVAFPFAVKLSMGKMKQRIEVIDVFKIDEVGKISEMRAYWGQENMKAD